MADLRTRRQKLEAMANQTASPHEAEVAKRKLAEMTPVARPFTTAAEAMSEFERIVRKMSVSVNDFGSPYVHTFYASPYSYSFAPEPPKCIHGLVWYHCFEPGTGREKVVTSE